MSFANAPGFATQDALAGILERITKDIGLFVTQARSTGTQSGLPRSLTVDASPDVAVYLSELEVFNPDSGSRTLTLGTIPHTITAGQTRVLSYPKPLRFANSVTMSWSGNDVGMGGNYILATYYTGEE